MSAFDQAWNLTQKSDFYFNSEGRGVSDTLEHGSHAGSAVSQKVNPESLEGFEKPTRMQRLTGKSNRMRNEAFNSADPDKHVETPFQPDQPFTDDTATRFDGETWSSGPEKLGGFNAEERVQRGENLQWDSQANEGQGNFRRGASRPRTTQRTMQTAAAQTSPVDNKGEWHNGKIDRQGKLWGSRPANNRPAVRLNEPTELATFEGANLSAQTQWDTDRIGEEKNERMNAYTDKKWGNHTEDEKINSLSSTLLHEGVHGAIQGDLDEAVLSGELSQENRTRADEIGAFSGQYFGDPKKVTEAMGYHDDVDRDAKLPKSILAKMFNPASCVFCDKLFTIPMGGVLSAYGAVCNDCKDRALHDTDETHEMEADRPDADAEYGFDEEFQDMHKEDTAFDVGWRIVKGDPKGIGEAVCPSCDAMAMIIDEGDGTKNLACNDCGQMDTYRGE